jgi:hypothetical protein
MTADGVGLAKYTANVARSRYSFEFSMVIGPPAMGPNIPLHEPIMDRRRGTRQPTDVQCMQDSHGPRPEILRTKGETA